MAFPLSGGHLLSAQGREVVAAPEILVPFAEQVSADADGAAGSRLER